MTGGSRPVGPFRGKSAVEGLDERLLLQSSGHAARRSSHSPDLALPCPPHTHAREAAAESHPQPSSRLLLLPALEVTVHVLQIPLPLKQPVQEDALPLDSLLLELALLGWVEPRSLLHGDKGERSKGKRLNPMQIGAIAMPDRRKASLQTQEERDRANIQEQPSVTEQGAESPTCSSSACICALRNSGRFSSASRAGPAAPSPSAASPPACGFRVGPSQQLSTAIGPGVVL